MQIEMTLTNEPSRSKQAGPCYVRIADHHGDHHYATTGGMTREIPEGPATLEVVARLRRSTRTSVDIETIAVIVTGDDADTISVDSRTGYLGACITGVKLDTTAADEAELDEWDEDDTLELTGNTYDWRTEIRDAGGSWWSSDKSWTVPGTIDRDLVERMAADGVDVDII